MIDEAACPGCKAVEPARHGPGPICSECHDYDRCFLCKRWTFAEHNGDFVLWVLQDGRLVQVCGICLDKVDRDEPVDETLTYEETYTDA